MNKIKQYIPRPKPMPNIGEIRELINRDRQVKSLGIIYGVLPAERTMLIRPINLDELGNVIPNTKESLA